MSKRKETQIGDILKESGPYKVDSMALSLGELRVRPKWQEYGEDWQTHQLNGQGGGPGVLSRMALADALEQMLNRNQVPQATTRWLANPIANMTHQEIQDAQDRAAGIDPKRKVVFHVTPEQQSELEDIAADEGTTVTEWLAGVVQSSLKEHRASQTNG